MPCPRCTSTWGIETEELNVIIVRGKPARTTRDTSQNGKQNGASLPIEIIADKCFTIFFEGNDCQFMILSLIITILSFKHQRNLS